MPKGQVRCIECGDRVSRRRAFPVRDEAGQVIGYLCRLCYQ